MEPGPGAEEKSALKPQEELEGGCEMLPRRERFSQQVKRAFAAQKSGPSGLGSASHSLHNPGHAFYHL